MNDQKSVEGWYDVRDTWDLYIDGELIGVTVKFVHVEVDESTENPTECVVTHHTTFHKTTKTVDLSTVKEVLDDYVQLSEEEVPYRYTINQ